jgi:hypothetical protein
VLKNPVSVTPAKAGVQNLLENTGFLLEFIPMKIGAGMKKIFRWGFSSSLLKNRSLSLFHSFLFI